MIAVVIATWTSRVRPVQNLVLDLEAGAVVLLAAVAAAQRPDSFALLAATAALLTSATAWLRTGYRRSLALGATGCAVLAAIAAQWQPLILAWISSHSQPWQGQPAVGFGTGRGLAFAVGVLTVSLAAVVTAAGAWRGGRRGSLDAVAVALPVVIGPALLGASFSYPLAFACLLVLALALTGWAALAGSLAPVGGAIIATALTVDWALAAALPTLIALGCLTGAYLLCARWAERPGGRTVAAGLSVVAGGAFVAAAVLAGGQPGWVAGLAMLGVAAAAQLVAAGSQGRLAIAIEAAGWLAALTGTAACLGRQGPASVAIALAGLLCVGVAWRRDRRSLLWVGLILLEVAWCIELALLGVDAIEPYTVPAAAILIAFGWHSSRRPDFSSWLIYGPGLALLLLPSLITAWQQAGWVRPALLAAAAAVATLIGARRRLQAPVLIGVAIAALDAGHQLAPAVRGLAEVLPGWVPIAIIGAVLLWAGATYEARLRNLRKARETLARLR